MSVCEKRKILGYYCYRVPLVKKGVLLVVQVKKGDFTNVLPHLGGKAVLLFTHTAVVAPRIEVGEDCAHMHHELHIKLETGERLALGAMSVLNTMLDPDGFTVSAISFLSCASVPGGDGGVMLPRRRRCAAPRPPTHSSRCPRMFWGNARHSRHPHVGAWINSLQVVRKKYAINQNPASSATSHL